MVDSFVNVKVDTKNVVLTSKSLFYKTENFIKQTRYVSNIDFLLSKLCEAIVLNLKQISHTSLKTNAFIVETKDKMFSFVFRLGYQIDESLNNHDIVFCDYISANKQLSTKVDEYILLQTELELTIQNVSKNFSNVDYNRLYMISTVSGVNLPRLNSEQKEIVETIDKNVLVQGVAGSGKTNICIDKIIFTACKNYTGKTLYTTFSRGLLNDTKLKVENYKNDLKQILKAYKEKKIVFLDNNHKQALQNRLGIYFFEDDDNHIFDKIQRVVDYLEHKIDYVLIEDMYKSKLDKNAKFVNQQYFINTYSRNLANHHVEKSFVKLSKYSKEVIFKEIYGMIFGSYNPKSTADMMGIEEYVTTRQNSFSRSDCESIYQIAVDYQKHLKLNGLVDNNLASRAIIEKEKDIQYSLAILDEVQDYTQVNLYMYKELSLKLFCVGDALQMINPTYFSFGYLKNLLYDKDVTDVKELKSNYRNTAEIVKVIDAMNEINRAEFGTHSFVLRGKSVDSGLKTTMVYLAENDFVDRISKIRYENFTIVVSNEKQKRELKKIITDQEVLTVSEIKGLERSTIITYNILSDNVDKWRLLEANKVNHKLADENSVFRYYYNLFYVALSRAKQNIFVVEDEKVSQFEKFFSAHFDCLAVNEAISELNKVVAKAEFTQREVVDRAIEFIKLEQYENARFMAGKIKDDTARIDMLRNIDINEKYISVGNYRDAGIKFWEYGMLAEAKKQFVLSNDVMLIELIDKCGAGGGKDLDIGIVQYYCDVEGNDIAQSFILDTMKKDVKGLKSSFKNIKDRFKQGR
ncbi:MAG: UvrD-helicase domain-containing protein [Clostridia bacterium]|nr:UvrD-helicase domain-containing protein [Clostridia bacterium]